MSGGTASPNYVSYYDAWGNVRSRTTGGIPAFLYYDALDHFTEWNASSNGHEWYVYDASGERILKRSTNASGTTTLTAYPFGDEHSYDSTGTNTIGNTYYYSLAGRLIGEMTGTSSTSTQYFLEDILGSPLATFSNAAGTTTVLGNQVYGPYGNQRYQGGSMGTTKGFTGQYNDSLTGIDYYGARYYDAKAGVFLSADSVEGNMQGMNPYGYVGGNPETMTDPTGQRIVPGEPGLGDASSTEAPVDCALMVCSSGSYFDPSKIGQGDGGGNGGGGNTGGGSNNPYNIDIGAFGGGGSGTPISYPTASGSSSGSDTASKILSNGTSSCGVQYGQAGVCGNFGVNYAAYTSMGFGISIPGEWCFVCGGGGVGGHGSDFGHEVVFSDEEGSGSQGAGASSGDDSEGGSNSTTIDLYRSGRAGDPKVFVGDLRKGQEYDVIDGNDVVQPGKGLSTFSYMKGAKSGDKWWKLLAGSPIPDGLIIDNDHGQHWVITPTRPMSTAEYARLVALLHWEGPIRIK